MSRSVSHLFVQLSWQIRRSAKRCSLLHRQIRVWMNSCPLEKKFPRFSQVENDTRNLNNRRSLFPEFCFSFLIESYWTNYDVLKYATLLKRKFLYIQHIFIFWYKMYRTGKVITFLASNMNIFFSIKVCI